MGTKIQEVKEIDDKIPPIEYNKKGTNTLVFYYNKHDLYFYKKQNNLYICAGDFDEINCVKVKDYFKYGKKHNLKSIIFNGIEEKIINQNILLTYAKNMEHDDGYSVYGTFLNDNIDCKDAEYNLNIMGNEGNDTIYSGTLGDIIYGDDEKGKKSGNDYIVGGGGDDLIMAGKGNDTISATDNSTIYAGVGNDVINYEVNSNTKTALIYGEKGDDIITITANKDISNAKITVNADKGNDTLIDNIKTTGNGNVIELYGSKGNDTYIITDLNGKIDYIEDSKGNDILYLSQKDVQFYFDVEVKKSGNKIKAKNLGDLHIYDMQDVEDENSGIVIEDYFTKNKIERICVENAQTDSFGYLTLSDLKIIANNVASWLYENEYDSCYQFLNSNPSSDLKKEFYNLYTPSWNKYVVKATFENNYKIKKSKGSWILYGNKEHKSELIASSGADTIIGYHSGDVIKSGGGNDLIISDYTSGNKQNIVEINSGSGNDTINLKGNYARIDASKGNDYIDCYGNYATIEAGNGNDTLYVTGNQNTISSSKGNDIISIKGNYATVDSSKGDDYIEIEGNNSQINAGDGNDCIKINGDDNIIIGSKGNDTIYCNGDNEFTFRAGCKNDTINMIEAKESNIIINFEKIAYDRKMVNRIGDNIFIQYTKKDKLTITNVSDDMKLIFVFIDKKGYETQIDGISNTEYKKQSSEIITKQQRTDNNPIYGAIGNDSLCGDENNDKIYGYEGQDTLCGGGGNNYLDGGIGSDTYYLFNNTTDENTTINDTGIEQDKIIIFDKKDDIKIWFNIFENGNVDYTFHIEDNRGNKAIASGIEEISLNESDYIFMRDSAELRQDICAWLKDNKYSSVENAINDTNNNNNASDLINIFRNGWMRSMD